MSTLRDSPSSGEAGPGLPNGLPPFPLDHHDDDDGDNAGRAAACKSKGSGSKTPQPKKASLNAIAFPLARVKRLIKSEGDTRVSSEATYVIAKGVGLFLEKFVEESFEHMIDDRRHSLTYKDLATHVSEGRRFHFLADFVPGKVTAASALSERIRGEE